jgi:putative membrane protein
MAMLAAVTLFSAQGFAADTKSALNASDEKFVKTAAQLGMKEVAVAELGAKKATSAEVKAFADMMIKDHTAANNELKAYATSKGVELSATAPAEAATTVQDLEKKSGKDFDAQFMDDMLADHKKVVDLFEDQQKNATDGDLKAWIDKTLPTLKAHLDHAKNLDAKQ